MYATVLEIDRVATVLVISEIRKKSGKTKKCWTGQRRIRGSDSVPDVSFTDRQVQLYQEVMEKFLRSGKTKLEKSIHHA